MEKETDFDKLLGEIDNLELKVKEAIKKHAENSGEWSRKTEALTDKLIQLGAWVNDYMHGRSCTPDAENPVYKRSMLRKVRMALKYSY